VDALVHHDATKRAGAPSIRSRAGEDVRQPLGLLALAPGSSRWDDTPRGRCGHLLGTGV